jgi:hypothetical protein
METDHIGLLLLATAGYHPCVAPCPLVYEKLAQFLSQADLMNEALELYKGVRPCSNPLDSRANS